MKRIVKRAKVDDDIEKAVKYFIAEAPEYTLVFVDSVQEAYKHIQLHPKTGSPKYAHELDVPGLRFWQCKRFPYLVFYIELANAIEVWRVLHGKQDIPETFRGEDV